MPKSRPFSCSYGKLQGLSSFGFVKNATTVCKTKQQDLQLDATCRDFKMLSSTAQNNGTQKVVDYFKTNCLGNTTCRISKNFISSFRDYLTPACQLQYDERAKQKDML